MTTSAAEQQRSLGRIERLLAPLTFSKEAIVSWNAPPAFLYESAIRSGEGRLAADGALSVVSHTRRGRSPEATFLAGADEFEGFAKLPLSVFQRVLRETLDHIRECGAHVRESRTLAVGERFTFRVTAVTELAWHSLYVDNIYGTSSRGDADADAEITVFNVPSLRSLDAACDDAVIAVDVARRLVIVTGTEYGGENKNGVLIALNALLPECDVLPLHASATERNGATSVFVGTSGGGKTTLASLDEGRVLGDDGLALTEAGLSPLERGVYATALGLAPHSHPRLYRAARKFRTILENVDCDERTGEPDFASARWTKNTCACFPLPDDPAPDAHRYLEHVFILAPDHRGVLPIISRLDLAEATRWFLAGYSSTMPDTEEGVRDARVLLSPCYAGPFLPLRPAIYGELFVRCMRRSGPSLWLVNTGWIGDARDTERRRLSLADVRAALDAARVSATRGEPVGERDPILKLRPLRDSTPAILSEPIRAWRDYERFEVTARSVYASVVAASTRNAAGSEELISLVSAT